MRGHDLAQTNPYDNRPAPLVDPEVTMGGNDWFPLHFQRLRKSRWWRKASDLARARNVMLWGEAYAGTPAGSLPDDDDELAEAAGFGMDAETFRLHKAEIMEPWTLCSDGHWYHPTLCEVILDTWSTKSAKRKAEAERKAAQRAKLREKVVEPAKLPPSEPVLVAVPRDMPENRRDIATEEKRGQDNTGEEPTEVGRQLVLVTDPEGPRPKARFDDGWKAYPKTGRQRSGKDASRPLWMRAAKAVGGEDELVRCIERYAKSPKALENNGEFVPGFHRWLKLGSAVNWTAEAVLEVGDEPRTGTRRGEGQRLDRLRDFDASFGDDFD